VTKHLVILFAAIAFITGCRHQQKPQGPETLPAEGFLENWRNPLELKSNTLARIYMIDKYLFAYSANNDVYVLGRAGGDLQQIDPLGGTPGEVRRPVLLDNRIIYPHRSSIQVFGTNGRRIGMLDLDHDIRSPLAGSGQFLYGGLDYPQGGRFVQIDLTRQYHQISWEVHTGAGVSSCPVIYQDTIYAATEEGNVYALNAHREPVWSLPNGVFTTQGPIRADLAADDYGLYVACTDTKLYVLDRGSGKIRWRYFAGTPLETAPVPTADSVYQYVRGEGMVALDKTTGDFDRKPRWTFPDGREFLSQDDQNVYLRTASNHIVAVDKKTGEAKFRSRRNDLTVFATNTTDATIYAGTKAGLVISIKPVTTPGAIGTVVKADEQWEQIASAR
jgi:outer membrane protein assembly factor BamB